MKSQVALEKNQKNTKRFEEKKGPQRVNLNDLIFRKKKEEQAIRKVNIINYSLSIILVLLVVLIFNYIKL